MVVRVQRALHEVHVFIGPRGVASLDPQCLRHRGSQDCDGSVDEGCPCSDGARGVSARGRSQRLALARGCACWTRGLTSADPSLHAIDADAIGGLAAHVLPPLRVGCARRRTKSRAARTATSRPTAGCAEKTVVASPQSSRRTSSWPPIRSPGFQPWRSGVERSRVPLLDRRADPGLSARRCRFMKGACRSPCPVLIGVVEEARKHAASTLRSCVGGSSSSGESPPSSVWPPGRWSIHGSPALSRRQSRAIRRRSRRAAPRTPRSRARAQRGS